MWVIASNNLCTFLGKYRNDGKLSSTSDLNKAFRFNTKDEAKNYIKNQMPKSVRDRYKVIDESQLAVEESSLEDFKWLELRSDENVDFFRTMHCILKKIPAYKKMLELKREQVEDALVDIYHYIEFNDIGTVQAYKIYKKEQELLRLRRKIKEEQFCVEQLNKYISLNDIKLGDYITALDKTKEKLYLPKVLVELFDHNDINSDEV